MCLCTVGHLRMIDDLLSNSALVKGINGSTVTGNAFPFALRFSELL